jgi:hypothetical protein
LKSSAYCLLNCYYNSDIWQRLSTVYINPFQTKVGVCVQFIKCWIDTCVRCVLWTPIRCWSLCKINIVRNQEQIFLPAYKLGNIYWYLTKMDLYQSIFGEMWQNSKV